VPLALGLFFCSVLFSYLTVSALLCKKTVVLHFPLNEMKYVLSFVYNTSFLPYEMCCVPASTNSTIKILKRCTINILKR